LGAVAGAHGVRGEVKIKSFTGEPRKIAAYGPVEDESGTRTFKLQIPSARRGTADRPARRGRGPQRRRGAQGSAALCQSDRLPKLKRGEWYLADLVD